MICITEPMTRQLHKGAHKLSHSRIYQGVNQSLNIALSDAHDDKSTTDYSLLGFNFLSDVSVSCSAISPFIIG